MSKVREEIQEISGKYLKAKEANSFFSKLKRKLKKSLVKLAETHNIREIETDDIKFKFNKEKRTYYSKSKLKNALSNYLTKDEIETALNSIKKTEIKKVYVNSNSAKKDVALAQYIERVQEI